MDGCGDHKLFTFAFDASRYHTSPFFAPRKLGREKQQGLTEPLLLITTYSSSPLLSPFTPLTRSHAQAGGRHLAAHWQLCGEFLTILAIVILIFVVIEPGYGLFSGSAVVNSLLLVALAAFGAGTVVFVNMYRQAEGTAFTMSRFRWVFAGWLWTMLCVISCLPLFCVPVFHAIDVIYPRSIFVGPLLRIGADVWMAVNYNVCVVR